MRFFSAILTIFVTGIMVVDASAIVTLNKRCDLSGTYHPFPGATFS
jgi:hypothetical protein